MPLLRTTSIATAIIVLPFTDVVLAANWQSTVVVPTSVEYDSNPLLLTSGEKGVTRTIIAPDYTLIGTFDQDELRLGLGMHVLRSSDTDVVDDREDPISAWAGSAPPSVGVSGWWHVTTKARRCRGRCWIPGSSPLTVRKSSTP